MLIFDREKKNWSVCLLGVTVYDNLTNCTTGKHLSSVLDSCIYLRVKKFEPYYMTRDLIPGVK